MHLCFIVFFLGHSYWNKCEKHQNNQIYPFYFRFVENEAQTPLRTCPKSSRWSWCMYDPDASVPRPGPDKGQDTTFQSAEAPFRAPRVGECLSSIHWSSLSFFHHLQNNDYHTPEAKTRKNISQMFKKCFINVSILENSL